MASGVVIPGPGHRRSHVLRRLLTDGWTEERTARELGITRQAVAGLFRRATGQTIREVRSPPEPPEACVVCGAPCPTRPKRRITCSPRCLSKRLSSHAGRPAKRRAA